MKYIIPIIILSLVLLSCKKDEAEEETTTTVLEGRWETACYILDNYSHYLAVTFAGNVLTWTDEKHSDNTSCPGVYSLTEGSDTFSMGDAGKFLVTAGTTKKTPKSSAAVTSFNSSSKCSANGWELNTAKDCTDDQGKNYFCFYMLHPSGNTLYAKCADSYPTSVDTTDTASTFTKQ